MRNVFLLVSDPTKRSFSFSVEKFKKAHKVKGERES